MNQTDYWGAGLHVFGMHSVTKGECDCGNPDCKALYKHPRVSNWQYTPHWEEAQLDMMEQTNQFKTGFGVLCDGWLVIDIDPRNGGKLDDFQGYYDQSGFVVATGGGGWHIYFRLPESVALVSHLPQYPGVDFKSSGFVVGAGSLHASGAAYEAEKGHPDDINDAPESLLELLAKKDRHRASVDHMAVDVTDAELRNMLNHIDPNMTHDDWVKIGMAIHHSTQGDGFALWDEWSSKGDAYDSKIMDRKWYSFGKSANPVTLGTLLHYAEEGGYIEPVTFEADIKAITETEGEINTDGIDLKRPPGFVGELCHWINSRCEYPNETLSMAAALNIVSACAGLKYEGGDKRRTKMNLFTYFLAGSGAGKQDVVDAVRDCMVEVGMIKAYHGGIKSQKGIIKNLLSNQMAVYLIDEISPELKKLAMAAEGKGSDYNTGIMGTLMGLYSSSGGSFGVEHDVLMECAGELKKEAAGLQKRIDGNEDKGGICQSKLDSIIKQLELFDKYNGIYRPFVSLLGFSTPVDFMPLLNGPLMKKGFFSRALIFEEPETNPEAKSTYEHKKPLDEKMRNTLLQLSTSGRAPQVRIENYDDPSPVEFNKEAKALSARVKKEFWHQAEAAKEMGLESVYRRGAELTNKIAVILGAPAGIVTEQDVLWAYKLAFSDLERKCNLTASNIAEEVNAMDEAICRKIIHQLTKSVDQGKDGITTGIIVNRVQSKKINKKAILGALTHMESLGKVRRESHKCSRAVTEKWFIASA